MTHDPLTNGQLCCQFGDVLRMTTATHRVTERKENTPALSLAAAAAAAAAPPLLRLMCCYGRIILLQNAALRRRGYTQQ